MGLFLIAESASLLSWIVVIVEVALCLGFVIFVHELGHFLVAKACGVQCDKFYIGFDAGGYKIWSRKWGETEYGIGIIPLGGYVKMLGQDDNPANAAREMERARLAKESKESDGEEGEAGGEPRYELNPRSYLAKSVPQRMAIISAGVIMNVIFAFVFAVTAYGIGAKYTPSIVSAVVPGSPAWEANLRPGDEIVQIGDVKKPRFIDLKYAVSLGDMENGVTMRVKRPGVAEPFPLTLVPEKTGPLPTIGIPPAHSLTLYDAMPAYPNSPAAQAQPALQGGDKVVAVDGQPVESYADLAAVLARKPDQPLKFTVLRETAVEGSKTPKEERIEVTVPANPMRRLGLVMRIGAITGVQKDSPAAKAGLKPDDFITQLGGEPVGDPVTLPNRLRKLALAGEAVVLTVERTSGQGPSETVKIPVTLRVPQTIEDSIIPGTPMSAPALGIAYRILNRVSAVVPGSPADKAGIDGGDEIVAARLAPTKEQLKTMTEAEAARLPKEAVKFGEKEPNWPSLVEQLQWLAPDTNIELTVRNGDKERQVTVRPVKSDSSFSPERGFAFTPVRRVRTADSFGDAIGLGWRETKESLLMVYRFLEKLGSGQIPATMLGGPITIAKAAGAAAFEGPAALLLFLTILSANLAVVNFLPIPVLDGGHMVFLIIEGVIRRPVSEKIVVAFQTVGFLFILSLMAFVIALDLGVISRGL